jgi:serine protease Do
MRLVTLTALFASSLWAQQSLHPPSAHLGVGVVEITPERAKALKLPTANGVEVVNVEENSAASRATIRNGDVILELNKEKVESVEDFVGAIAASSPGKKLALTVWREGSKRFLTATLENQRASGVSTFSSSSAMSQTFDIMPLPAPMIGIDGEPLTQQLAQYFGVEDGVLVMTVHPHTPAERAGMKAGDVILKVNGTPVSSPREISALLRPGRKPMSFTVMRNHKEITLSVDLALLFEPWPNTPPDGLYLACSHAR